MHVWDRPVRAGPGCTSCYRLGWRSEAGYGRGRHSEDYPHDCLAWILAQLSRNPIVRLNTGESGDESRSALK